MLFNQYPGTVSPEFYALLADLYRCVDELEMIEFLLGDGQ